MKPIGLTSRTSAAAMLLATVSFGQLDDSWTIAAGGQSVRGNPDGSFLIQNIPIADEDSDALSDDYFQVTGTSTQGGMTLYALTEFFRVRANETYFVTNLIVTDQPPVGVQSLSIDPSVEVLAVGESVQLAVTATLSDLSMQEVTLATSRTLYSTSNPAVASVMPNGHVDGIGMGTALITARNNGAAAVARIEVSRELISTTVVGFAFDAAGNPLMDADISTNFGSSAVSALDGSFSLPLELPPQRDVTVFGKATVGATSLVGASSATDVVEAGFTDAGVIVLAPGGRGPLFPQEIYDMPYKAVGVAMGDLDQDEDLDAVVTGFGGPGYLTFLYNDGYGSFERYDAVTTGSGINGQVVADLDGDDLGDVAWAISNGQPGVHVLLNRGDRVFDATGPFSGGRGLAAGDLDCDGDVDLISGEWSSPPNIYVLRNQGGGVFSSSTVQVGSVGTDFRVFGLATGQGHAGPNVDVAIGMQVLSSSGLDNRVFMGINEPCGTVTPMPPYGVQGMSSIAHPIMEDIDFDGVADVIVPNAGGIAVLINDGFGALGVPMPYGTGGIAVGIAAGDMDRQLGPDFCIAVGGIVEVLGNDGFGAFGVIQQIAAGWEPRGLGSGDLDGDGWPDLIVANVDLPEEGNASILMNAGTGEGTLVGAVSYAAGPATVDIAAGDINEDGFPDIVVVNGEHNDEISLLLNDTSGGFPVRSPLAISNPQLAVIGQLNPLDDAHLDLAVRAGSGTVVLLGDGAGNFATSSTLLGGGAMRVSDMSGDGFEDIVYVAGDVFIRLNDGHGGFSSLVNVSGSGFAALLAIGDVDGDEDADIITGNGTTEQIFVVINQGAGNFTVLPPVSVGMVPIGIDAGDLDGDGDADVAITNRNSNSVSIGLSADGVLAMQTIQVGMYPMDVSILDADGDGDRDVVVSQAGASSITVLINNGVGVFNQRRSYSPGPLASPDEMTFADVDQDGDDDLLFLDDPFPTGAPNSIVWVLDGQRIR